MDLKHGWRPSKGKTARFRIELGSANEAAAEDSKDFSFKFGKGRFVAEQGSDASFLLMDLRQALISKTLPINVNRSATVPFTFVNLGEMNVARFRWRIQRKAAGFVDCDENLPRGWGSGRRSVC
jgi:hypothetical protein